uniref:Thyroglobulin type-1 domain-containing protein n=1 Tax=Syphacia muris TaxID=451379 RepID=A0A0N5APH9_9BILA
MSKLVRSLCCRSMNEEHTPGTLGGRQIYWCPSGEGYLPYCPQTTDPTDYNYCCVYEEFGIQRPSCCRHAIHTGLLLDTGASKKQQWHS